MKVMVFLPSYNDTAMAYEKSVNFLNSGYVSKILIVDDSDDQNCIKLAKKIVHERIQVISRKRSGKWTAWRLALQLAKDYDGLVEIDSDVEVEDIGILILSLKSYDVVTAYPEILLPKNYLGRRIAKVYRRMHEELKRIRKFNMGGQVIALSKKAISALVNQGFFEEPVVSDDHVIGLAACVLGLRCTTVDCGLRIRLPSTLEEWIRYRSRHRQAIKRTESYVGLKTGQPHETITISRSDMKLTLKYFLGSLKKEPILACAILLSFFLGFILPIESQTEWTRLESEK